MASEMSLRLSVLAVRAHVGREEAEMNNMVEDLVHSAPGAGVRRRVGYFELRQTLGRGMSGKVKLGIDTRTGEAVAIKIMFQDRMTTRVLQQLHREITAMKALQHPNVLRLREVLPRAAYPKKDGTPRDAVVLVLDLAGGGELFDFMMHTGAFPEPVARAYFLQLLSALELCHRHGIAHRDIKPENLLLDETFVLKLADFGLSNIMEDAASACLTECGTRSYMAPEVLARQPYDGFKADLWSAGVVLFIMIAGNPPFQAAHSADWWFKAVSTHRHDRFWAAHLRGCPNFPAGAQAFLNKIFIADPAHRGSIEELRAHPWLAGETWPPERIATELQTRQRRVVAQKEAERAAHLRRKAADAVRAGRGLVDPFARAVNRSVAAATPAAPAAGGASTGIDGEARAASVTAVEAPMVPDVGFDPLTALYSAERAGPLLERVAAALAACADAEGGDVPAVTVKHDGAKVKAVFAGRELEVVANVYASSQQGCHVVAITRRAGDVFAFRDVREKVAAALAEGGAIGCTRDVETAPPVDAFDLEEEEAAASVVAAAAAAAVTVGSAANDSGVDAAAAALATVTVTVVTTAPPSAAEANGSVGLSCAVEASQLEVEERLPETLDDVDCII
ncbi:unnamed protein product [Phaeothamnion confervicola]